MEIIALKERTWFNENIRMVGKNPKEYYKGIFNEIIEEIEYNKHFLKENH